jgi:hypothetical protein
MALPMSVRLSLVAASLLLAPASPASIINVPANQPNLAAAVAAAISGDEIVLADGVYSGASNRNIVFGGKNLIIRSASLNPALCVIDLESLGRGFTLQNGETAALSRIEGLTIRNGVVPGGAAPNDRGAGVRCVNGSVTIRNCVFDNNRANNANVGGGGATFFFGSNSIVSGCTFTGNNAGQYGGASEVFSSTVAFQDCVFSNNTARVGGAIEFGQGTGTVTNCLFLQNQVGGTAAVFGNNGGGAIAMYNNSNVTVRNSTFFDNRSNWAGASNGGGGFIVSSSSLTLSNSILWKNVAVTGTLEQQQLFRLSGPVFNVNFTTLEGLATIAGAGNLATDPAFVDAVSPGFDLRLGAGSPAIDSASNPLAAPGVTTDLAGQPRFVDAFNYPDSGVGPAPVIDRGAYEAAPGTPSVCPGDLDGDGAVGASDLASLLGAWGSGPGPADLDGNGVVGAGDLAALLGAWGAC